MEGLSSLSPKKFAPSPVAAAAVTGPAKVHARHYSSAIAAIFILLLIFALLQSLLPLSSAIRIGPDEGYEVAKATLCLKGFKLYTQVWNDQPPLHTFLITEIIKHTCHSMLGPRLLTVCAAMLLIMALYTMALRMNGLWVAGVAVALLIASPGFLELSSSCMVEIPGLAPAVAALCVILVARQSKWPKTEILAGLLFGISFQIKLINLVLLPMAALLIWRRHGAAASRVKQLICSCAILAAFAAATFVAINYAVDGGSLWLQIQQAWAAHFAKTKSYEYGSPADRPFQWTLLLKNWDTTLPALAALLAFVILQSRKSSSRCNRPSGLSCRRTSTKDQQKSPGHALLEELDGQGWGWLALGFPLIWLGLSLSIFGSHRPWWPCYYVHNEVPLCWCAAIGIDLLRRAAMASLRPLTPPRNQALRRGTQAASPGYLRMALSILRVWPSRLVLAYLICALPWLALRIYLQVQNVRDFPTIYNSLVLKELNKLSPFADWLYTNEPIYSFHAGIPMPPELAVVALKRFWSGDMTNERLAADLSAIKPSVILIPNDSHVSPFHALLGSDYRLIFMDSDFRLYTRKDVALRAQL